MHGKRKERQTWIDLAKFLGVLFVLAAHADLRIPVISDFGLLFYVPIFFVTAGYTYHEREESFLDFAKRKAKGLLVPYFGYSLFLYFFFLVKEHLLLWNFRAGVWEPLGGILYARNSLYPPGCPDNTYFMTIWNSPLWFLPALFLSLLLFELGIRIGRKNCGFQKLYLLLCLLIGLLLHMVSEVLLPWSLDTVFLLQFLIAFGYWLQQKHFPETDNQKIGDKIAIVIIIAVFMAAAVWNGEMNLSVGDFGNSLLVGMLNAAVSSAIVLRICYSFRHRIRLGLQLLGESTLCIMALHMFVFMFVKAGFNIINPAILSENGIGTDIAKIIMICVTLAVLTVTNVILKNKGKSIYD